MTEVTAPRRPRGRLEWAAIIGLPILVNALLTVYLMTQLESGALPVVGDLDAPAPVIGSPDQPLPEPSSANIVNAVERETDSDYVCDGPWRLAGGISAWSCRTQYAVANMQGVGSDGVFRLDVTWFGFDEARTELPAWAAAALGSSPEADTAALWVAEHLGTDAQTRIGGASLVVDGAEGARTLLIEGG
jgi:hypothetical protein